jgi:hypothetical protein
LKLELTETVRKSNLAHSSLWNRDYIESLNRAKKTTHEINKLRANYLMPATDLTQIESHSQIPVILVQNTIANSIFTIKHGTLHTGWDLIMPNTWAMPFWICLVHFGARAIAQNELNYLLFESGNLQFPHEHCDTVSSQVENEKVKCELYVKYCRKPASKRVNYLKHGSLSAFYYPLSSILSLSLQKTTNLNEASFFILRDKKILNQLSTIFFQKNKQIKSDTSKLALMSHASSDFMDNSYIAIRLSSYGKGTLDKFSLIFNYDKGEQETMSMVNEHSKLVVDSLIGEHRREFISKLEKSQKTNKATLNQCLRKRFNKNELLCQEASFFKYQVELSDSESFSAPIGVVLNSHFNLATGTCSANGLVLSKSIMQLITRNETSAPRNLVTYKTPDSPQISRIAKIEHFFI